MHKEWTSLVPTQLSCTLTLVIQVIRSLSMLLIMEEIRRLQAQLRRMRQKGFPAADYYQPVGGRRTLNPDRFWGWGDRGRLLSWVGGKRAAPLSTPAVPTAIVPNT